jgi:hypothetical protein
MRCSISIIIVMLLMPSLCLAGSGIPDSEQFIIKGGSDADVIADGSWTPTKAETQKALEAITAFLNDPDRYEETIKGWTTDLEYAKGEIGKIRENFSKYGVQFTGVTLKGKRLIHCNFGPADRIDKNYLMVEDGGFWFWQIDYDISTGILMKLYIIGYA